MNLATLREKNAHPIAVKIPETLWRPVFGGHLDFDFSLADKELSAIARDDLPKDALPALVLFLICQPKLSAENQLAFIQNNLKMNNSVLFWICATLGQLPLCKLLKESVEPKEFDAMIGHLGYMPFYFAAENGQLDTCKWIKAQAPAAFAAMIKAQEFRAFCGAAQQGHLDTCKWIKNEITDEQFTTLVKSNNFSAFRKAGANGHLDTCKWLAKESPELLQDMIQADDYFAFRLAAQHGKTETLKWLKKQVTPDVFAKMIASSGYFALRSAASNGHRETCQWIKEQVQPAVFAEMIRANDFEPLKGAARGGHLATCQWIKSQVSPLEFGQMLAANDHAVFLGALHSQDEATCRWLLQHPVCFNHEEAGTEAWITKKAIVPFVKASIQELRDAQAAGRRTNPNFILDIKDADTIQNCFYLVRNIVRRPKETALQDDLHFLLEIPAVRAMVLVDKMKGSGSELLTLARRLDSDESFQAIQSLSLAPQAIEPAEPAASKAGTLFDQGKAARVTLSDKPQEDFGVKK